MSNNKDSATDVAALLTALAGLPGVDQEAMRKAQKAMADVLGAGIEYQGLLEKQWSIMQATADVVRRDGDFLKAPEASVATGQSLAQARACFDLAVEAVRALSESANAPGEASVDAVLREFHEGLARVRGNDNN